MLIKQLLAGRKRSDFVIIKDNNSFNGLEVLKKFIEEGNNRNIPVHLIVSEYDMNNFNVGTNVFVNKFFPDPWGLLPINDEQGNFELLIDRILRQGSPTGSPILIVIDSIASILQYVGIHTICKCLKKCSTTLINNGSVPVAQVVTLLHTELYPDDSLEYKYLNYIATTLMVVQRESDGAATLNAALRQSNGKLLKETYSCSFGPNRELLFEIKKDPPKPKQDNNEDILVKTTFKLKLEEKEKESRSQVVLPYLKTSNTIGKGRIFYEPDVHDDWDDEDPDDDLEI